MPEWLDFRTCFEVEDRHIEGALAPAATVDDVLPRQKVFDLLDRMAQVAKPRQGAPRILAVIARLCSCDWLDGDLEVRVLARGADTFVDLVVHDGMLRSRLRPTLVVRVPFLEFETALRRIEGFIEPLQITEIVEGRVATLGVGECLEPYDHVLPAPRQPAAPRTSGIRASRRAQAAPMRQAAAAGAPPPSASRGERLPAVAPTPRTPAPATPTRPGRAAPPPKPTVRMEVPQMPPRAPHRVDGPPLPGKQPAPPTLARLPAPQAPLQRPRDAAQRRVDRPDPKATIRMRTLGVPAASERSHEAPRRHNSRPSLAEPQPNGDVPTVRPPLGSMPEDIWAAAIGEAPPPAQEEKETVRPPMESLPEEVRAERGEPPPELGLEPVSDRGKIDESW